MTPAPIPTDRPRGPITRFRARRQEEMTARLRAAVAAGEIASLGWKA